MLAKSAIPEIDYCGMPEKIGERLHVSFLRKIQTNDV